MPDVCERPGRWAGRPGHHRAGAADPRLNHQRPGDAASPRKSLAETLTVTQLGVGGKPLQTVESTNPIESMIEIVGDHATRVKRWNSGDKALRWATAGMLAAQTQFRRVKGYQELPAGPDPRAGHRPSLECSTCHRLEVARRAEVADLARYTNRPGSG